MVECKSVEGGYPSGIQGSLTRLESKVDFILDTVKEIKGQLHKHDERIRDLEINTLSRGALVAMIGTITAVIAAVTAITSQVLAR